MFLVLSNLTEGDEADGMEAKAEKKGTRRSLGDRHSPSKVRLECRRVMALSEVLLDAPTFLLVAVFDPGADVEQLGAVPTDEGFGVVDVHPSSPESVREPPVGLYGRRA
jgi:hypothetical protein